MPSSPEIPPLVYTQDDDFVVSVGEALEPSEIGRVIIAKRDRLCAETLRAACAREFPAAQIAVWREAEPALESLRGRAADFALLGLSFAHSDGLDLLATINREHLARRVVLVSGRKDERTLQLLHGARFDGFLDPLEEGVAEVDVMLRQVTAGQGYLSRSLVRHMIERRRGGVLMPRLSPAELHVLIAIGDGSDDAEAAAQLGLAESTVQTHRRNIMRKLGIGRSAKLVREAVRLGVVRFTDTGVLRPGFDPAAGSRRAEKSGSSNAVTVSTIPRSHG